MPRTATPTFDELATEYLRLMEHQRAKGTMRLYRSYIRNYLSPEFGHLHLSSIGKPQVVRWIGKLRAAGKSETTIKAAYTQLKSMMNFAADELEYIPSWPVRIRGMGSDKSKPRPTFTVADYHRVLKWVDPKVRPAFIVAVGASLRVSELSGLNVGDWNPASRSLRVERQYYLAELKATKTGTVEEVWPLPFAADVLDELTRGRRPEQPMFMLNNTRMSGRLMRDAWTTARRLVNLDQFHLHDLRHLGLSIYAQAGATLAETMAHGRHRDRSSALRYQHAGTMERRRELAERAGAAFA